MSRIVWQALIESETPVKTSRPQDGNPKHDDGKVDGNLEHDDDDDDHEDNMKTTTTTTMKPTDGVGKDIWILGRNPKTQRRQRRRR